MMTAVERKGWDLGWDDAERYARGTRRDRREIRRRLAKAELSRSEFWRAYADIFHRRAGDFADAIRQGRIARTCRASRIWAVLNRSQVA